MDITNASSHSELATSQNSDRWQAIPFGNRTILLNSGTDNPLRIEADGSITGVHGWTVESGQTLDVADLFNAVPFKNRLIFIEKDSSDLWYGPLNGIQGELKKFPLGGVSPAGGNVLGAGTITLDGGQGPDDLFVVFLSSGAALIYSRNGHQSGQRLQQGRRICAWAAHRRASIGAVRQ